MLPPRLPAAPSCLSRLQLEEKFAQISSVLMPEEAQARRARRRSPLSLARRCCDLLLLMQLSVWIASLPTPSSAVFCFNQLQTIQPTTRTEYGKIVMSALEATYNPTGEAESTNCAEFNSDDTSEATISCER